MTLGEANEIGSKITNAAAPNANVLWGARVDPDFKEKVEVIAIFTGVRSSSMMGTGGAKKYDEDDSGIPMI